MRRRRGAEPQAAPAPAPEPAPEPGHRGPDARPGTLRLTLRQGTPPTPGQPEKAPLPMPVAVGLLAPDGTEALPTTVLTLEGAEASFELPAPEGAVLSFLRGFSAPVIVRREVPDAERAFSLASDPDPFARWEAGRQLSKAVLVRAATEGAAPDPGWLSAMREAATDDAQDPAVRALVLALPSVEDVAQTLDEAGGTPDPGAIHDARERVADALAAHLAPGLPTLREAAATPGPYDPGPGPAGRRALGLAALGLLTRLDGGEAARAAFAAATNLTEELGALGCLLQAGDAEAAAAFRARWEGERLVLDRWFAAQVLRARPEEAAATALRLTRDPAFDPLQPQPLPRRLGRAGAERRRLPRSHRSRLRRDGGRDRRARPAQSPGGRPDDGRVRDLAPPRPEPPGPRARAALERIAGAEGLPPDVEEMASRLLADG